LIKFLGFKQLVDHETDVAQGSFIFWHGFNLEGASLEKGYTLKNPSMCSALTFSLKSL
jgi:hypothetical protein